MYGLIGKKLGHSYSADFFNKKFKEECIDESYQLFELPTIEDFPRLIKENPQIEGLNVTIPYKESVIQFLDSLADEAIEIGAVNVIKVNKDGEEEWLKGYNTDAIGFKESITPLLRKDITHALILGSGGASKAVVYALTKLGITPRIVSRNPSGDRLGYDDLDEATFRKYKLIVNATPIGMYPAVDDYPPIPYQYINEENVCFDLIYNPEETAFMKKCKQQGAVVKNGYEMWYLQALATWNIWNA